MEKKFAIIGDIHSNYYILEKVMEELKSQKIQNYIFCGDYILDGFDGNKVLDTIKKMENAIVIKGNKEELIQNITQEEITKMEISSQYCNIAYGACCLSSQNKKYIESLPCYKIIEINGVRICISHGSPYHAREMVTESDEELFEKLIEEFQCNIYIFAHTHLAWNRKYKDAYFINPGSISLPVDGPEAKYGILTIKQKEIVYEPMCFLYDFKEIVNYYHSNQEYCTKARDWCSIVLTMIRDGYDHREMAFQYAKKVMQERNIPYNGKILEEIWREMYEWYDKKYHFVK